MSISAQAPFVSVLVSPVDPEAANRTQWTLSENFAGCFQAGSDGNAGEGGGLGSFQSVQFANIPTLANLQGPVDFVRFTGSGRVEHGTTSAIQSNPSSELCGLTVQLRREQRLNRIEDDKIKLINPSQDTETLTNIRELPWKIKQGKWETVLPAREPLDTCIHTQPVKPNQTYKIETAYLWEANRGFVALWDFDGIPEGHKSGPAVRITWGAKWSLLFRGKGPKARPSLELREKGKWRCVRVFNDCTPLDDQFWKSSHTMSVQCIGARLCVALNGIEYGIVETSSDSKGSHPTPATWGRAPLQVSSVGCNVAFRVHLLTGDSEYLDDKGYAKPLVVSFTRMVAAPGMPFFEQKSLGFELFAHDVYSNTIDLGLRGSIDIRAQMLGTDLGRVGIEGKWEGLVATYDVAIFCNSTAAPLLSCMAVEFKPLPTSSPPAPIEIRPALSSLSVDSGDPESMPDAEASLSLSQPLLEQLVPDWKTAILPYRPIVIRVKYDRLNEDWTTLFRGFLTPDSTNREGWNAKQLPLVARGPLVRLSQPAALVDERFGPLDLQIGRGRSGVWGAEAAKILLTVELGPAWTDNFNGDGNPFSYLPAGHYPLLDSQNGGLFDATQAPTSGNWRLPPPFGSDLKSWLDTLAKFDDAVWFFDAASSAFYYGRIIEMLIERGHTTWTVPETAPPPEIRTTRDWPILTSLSKSGLLEKAFNDVRVWGGAAKGMEGLKPSFLMGRAGDSDPNSLDPLSVVQSWRRTLLLKPDFVKEGVVDEDYPNGLARSVWRGYKGRPPVRMDAEFESGFLGPRWGEILHLPTGFDGPHDGGRDENWRIMSVKHSFDFSGSENRFSTTLTTRTISAEGQ